MLILGGGIIGLSCAWQLARSGVPIEAVIDSEELPSAARASAGMLAPFSEGSVGREDLVQKGQMSLELYPSFLEQLREDSHCGVPELSSKGTLLLAEQENTLHWLKQRYKWLCSRGVFCHWLSRKELREKEPFIDQKVCAAIHIPCEREILVPQLISCLRAALQKYGVPIIDKKVSEVHSSPEWTLLLSNGEVMQSSQLLVTCGAWLPLLPFPQQIQKPSIIPAKGQTLLVHPRGTFSLQHMLRTQELYICPKADGSIRLGAETEFVGHHKYTSAIGSMRRSLQDCHPIFPALDHAEFLRVDSGLRPCSTELLPTVGSSDRGLYWACGHGRSGILLTPWTAYTITQQLSSQPKEALL